MSEDQSQSSSLLSSKTVLFTGLALQCLFLIGSILLFRERTLYADTAHFAAEIAGGPRFYLGHRFIALFSRIFPFINAVAGGSYKSGLILYSLNLALIFTLPYLVIGFVLKDRVMAFCLLLLQFIFTYRTFYLPISELQHGLVFLILYWAYIRFLMQRGKPASRSIWTYALLAVIINAHPMIILAFAGTFVLFSEHPKYWNSGDQKILLPMAVLLYLLFSLVFSSKYEAVIFSNALGELFTAVNTYKIRLILHTLLHDYFPTIVVAALGLGLLLYRYPLRKSLFIILCIIVAGILLYLRFAHVTFTLTFFEIYLLPVPFLLFLVIGLNWESIAPKLRIAILPVLVVFILIQIIRVSAHAKFYSERLEVYGSVMEQMQEKGLSKVVLPFYKAPMDKIVDFYASPFESYLLSYLDEDPGNDGYLITYLLQDSVDINSFGKYDQSIITLGMDSIDLYPFERYPAFDLSTAPYSTFDPTY